MATREEFEALPLSDQYAIMEGDIDLFNEKGDPRFISGRSKHIPDIPFSYRERLNNSLEAIWKICEPTITRLAHKSTKLEIQEKLYVRIAHETDKLNDCLYNSRDVTDANKCSEKLAQYMENDILEYTKKLISEY